jgi:hypothetical protein
LEKRSSIIFFIYFRDYLGKQVDASAGGNSNATSNGLGQRPLEGRA